MSAFFFVHAYCPNMSRKSWVVRDHALTFVTLGLNLRATAGVVALASAPCAFRLNVASPPATLTSAIRIRPTMSFDIAALLFLGDGTDNFQRSCHANAGDQFMRRAESRG